ncbi:MAG: HAMP domain-containing protein, partial [Anaerolineae bacterium]
MERQIPISRALNTLVGRLAGLALILILIVLAGGVVVSRQLIRIRDAVIAMQEASTYMEMALSSAHQTTELVLNVREGVDQGLGGAELNRRLAPYLVTLETQRQALQVEAEHLPPGSDLQARMATVGTVLGNVSGVARQILQAVEQEDRTWARYLLAQLSVNHRLVEQETIQLVVLARARHEQAQAEARLAARRVLIVVPLATVAVILVAAGAAVLLLRGVVTGVRMLSDSAGQLAVGRLETRVPERGLEEFRSLARTFNNMASELQQLYTGLERLVARRTADLARRTAQLEAAAFVARRAAEIRDVDTLLNETVRLISDRFGFYHAGIFLI